MIYVRQDARLLKLKIGANRGSAVWRDSLEDFHRALCVDLHRLSAGRWLGNTAWCEFAAAAKLLDLIRACAMFQYTDSYLLAVGDRLAGGGSVGAAVVDRLAHAVRCSLVAAQFEQDSPEAFQFRQLLLCDPLPPLSPGRMQRADFDNPSPEATFANLSDALALAYRAFGKAMLEYQRWLADGRLGLMYAALAPAPPPVSASKTVEETVALWVAEAVLGPGWWNAAEWPAPAQVLASLSGLL